mmetsp:Transcript_16595/g.19967  ORF Transcript_16595/g.19967 Transcript_16595/m.19967 type:complete len:334 (+) Transcript_16595:120-1121(+)
MSYNGVHIGVVVSYGHMSGYGFINRPGHADIFVGDSDIIEGVLFSGVSVKYTIRQNGSGRLFAKNVQVVSDVHVEYDHRVKQSLGVDTGVDKCSIGVDKCGKGVDIKGRDNTGVEICDIGVDIKDRNTGVDVDVDIGVEHILDAYGVIADGVEFDSTDINGRNSTTHCELNKRLTELELDMRDVLAEVAALGTGVTTIWDNIHDLRSSDRGMSSNQSAVVRALTSIGESIQKTMVECTNSITASDSTWFEVMHLGTYIDAFSKKVHGSLSDLCDVIKSVDRSLQSMQHSFDRSASRETAGAQAAGADPGRATRSTVGDADLVPAVAEPQRQFC